jgi:hypothetical protein
MDRHQTERLSGIEQPHADRRGSLRRGRPVHGALANLLLVTASLVIAFVVLEVALGFTPYRYLTHPRVQFPPGYYVNDSELGADLAPNRPPAPFLMRGPTVDVFTNQWGCFDHDQPAGEGYVLAIGDSTTWGFAALEDKWTTRLEALSGQRVLKCGMTDTGPKHQAIKARKTIEKIGRPPALILVLYDRGNDLNDDALFPKHAVVDGYLGYAVRTLDLRSGELTRDTQEEFEQRHRQYIADREAFSLTNYLTEHLTTFAMLRHYLERRSDTRTLGPILDTANEDPLWQIDTELYPWVLEAYEDHLEALRALKRLASDYGAELVMITDGIPEEGLRGQLREFMAAEFPYHLDVAELMAEAAQGRRIRYHHDSHWNELGNRLAGEIIYQYLSEAGLIPSERAGEDFSP